MRKNLDVCPLCRRLQCRSDVTQCQVGKNAAKEVSLLSKPIKFIIFSAGMEAFKDFPSPKNRKIQSNLEKVKKIIF